MVRTPADGTPSLESILASLDDVDLVLVEGYGTASHPKVRVERAGFCSDSNVAAGPFIALVGTGSSNDAPRFAPDAVDPLVDYLTSRLFGNRFSAQKEDFAS